MTAPALPRGGTAASRLAALVGTERETLAARLAAARVWALAAATLGVLAVGVIVLGGGRWFMLWRWLPLAWWALAAGGGLAAWRAVRRRAPVPAADAVARAIEEARTLRTGELRVALEGDAFGAFGDAMAARTLAKLGDPGGALAPALHDAADARRGWWQRAALGAAAATLGATAAWPDGARALALPLAAAHGTLLAAMRIEAPRVALRGARPAVRVHAPGRARVVLAVREPAPGDTTPRRLALAVRDGIAAGTLPPLVRGTVTLVAEDGRGESAPVTLRVAELPYLGDVTARAEYPAYLGRAAEELPLGGVLVVPRGTVLRITAHASVPVRDVALVGEAGARVPLAVDGDAARGMLAAERSGRWAWRAASEVPLQSLPAPFALDVRADSAPVVELASTSDTLLAARDAIALELRAADDHGLASVALEVWTGTTLTARRALATNPGATYAATVPLDLGALGVADAATVTVRAVAVDGSPWRQVGRSRALAVRRGTIAERRAAARAAADSVASAASALAKSQAQLAQRTGDAARGAATRPGDKDAGLDFDGRERAQALAEQQRALQRQAEQLQRQAKQLEEQLRSAGALDTALAGRLAEAQRLMQQAISPQMMDRLRQLEQGAQRLDAQRTRQSLEELARQQQALREQLERNAQMLQRAALEGSMETLRDEARELAQAQRARADSAARGARGDPGRELQRRAERLARDVEQLGKRLREADAQPGARRADAARDAAKRSAQRLQQGDDAQAAADAAKAMEEAAERLGDAREEQVEAWKRETTAELDQASAELMQLGEQERRLADAAQRQGLDRQKAGEQASVQAGVQQAAERLRDAARKSQHVSQGSQRALQEALQRVAEATRAAQRGATAPPRDATAQGAPQPPSQGGMPQPGAQPQGAQAGRDGAQGAAPAPGQQGASGEQGAPSADASGRGSTPGASGQRAGDAANAMRDAAQALERAASSLVRDRERANRARSASGMPEMLEELAQAARQQQQINGRAGAMSMLPGGEGGAQAQAMAQQLARRQRQLAQRLDDASGSDGSGRAEALAEESRRLADAMERAMNDPATARRREEFYQRLLSAGRTLRRDDMDENQPRESRPGIGAATYLPPGGDARGAPASPVPPPSWEALRGLRDDERRAVLEYFERLNRQPPPKP